MERLLKLTAEGDLDAAKELVKEAKRAGHRKAALLALGKGLSRHLYIVNAFYELQREMSRGGMREAMADLQAFHGVDPDEYD
jgi:hypothetical protein